MRPLKLCVLMFFAVGLVFAIFLPYLNNPLVFDDEYFFMAGEPAKWMANGFHLSPRWWVHGTLVGTFIFFSENISWLRLENIVLHLGTAGALFFLVRQLLKDLDSRQGDVLGADTAALIAAFLFAVHPVAILSQGYLIQRTIVCATLFGLLGLWMFWRGISGKRWALWVSCGFIFLSISAKQHAVMLPALCFLLWVLQRRSKIQSALATKEVVAALVVQSLVSLSVVLWSKGLIGHNYEVMTEEVLSDESFRPDGSLYLLSILNQVGLFFNYLATVLFPRAHVMALDLRVPFPLSYGVWWLWTGLGAFVAYGVGALLLFFRSGNRGLLGFALLFPWVLFATELASVRLQEPFVLYRSYLWMPGLFLMLAMAIRRLKQIYLLTLIPVCALYFMGLSYDRLMMLSSPYFVWEESAKYLESQAGTPGLFGGYRIYYNLGNASLDAGMAAQALKNFDRTIELKPSYGFAYHQRGIIYLQQRNWAMAKAEFLKAIELTPAYVKPYYGVAEALQALDRPEEAQHYLELGCSKGSQVLCDKAYPKSPLVLAPKL